MLTESPRIGRFLTLVVQFLEGFIAGSAFGALSKEQLFAGYPWSQLFAGYPWSREGLKGALLIPLLVGLIGGVLRVMFSHPSKVSSP